MRLHWFSGTLLPPHPLLQAMICLQSQALHVYLNVVASTVSHAPHLMINMNQIRELGTKKRNTFPQPQNTCLNKNDILKTYFGLGFNRSLEKVPKVGSGQSIFVCGVTVTLENKATTKKLFTVSHRDHERTPITAGC